MEISETGKGGLTEQTRKLCERLKVVHRDFWYSRNQQTKLIGSGKIARLPNNEKGKPDFEVLYQGTFGAFELKTKQGKLSKDQATQQERIINAGGKWFTCRSIDDVYNGLSKLGLQI